MKKLMMAGAVALCCSLPFATFAADAPPANSVTINIVKNPVGVTANIGNMVDPVTGQFWYNPNAGSSWKWGNNGSNVEKFALMVNFVGGMPDKSAVNTAIGAVVIDPSVLAGNANVNIQLKKCKIGPSNYSYKVTGNVKPGVTFTTFSTQPACN